MTDAAPPILFELDGHVAVLTMNRPDRHNVLDSAATHALSTAVRTITDLVARGEVRCLLLRSTGRSFCGGGDINEFPSEPDALAERLDKFLPSINSTLHELANLPIPVVSALNGAVAGGGIGLAFCADIVIAAESMVLRGGYCAIGLSPDVGSSWFLAQAIGAVRAKRIFFSNDKFSAADCERWGLVTEVVSNEKLDKRSIQIAHQLADSAVRAIARTKSLLGSANSRTLEQQMALEHKTMLACVKDPESAEGIAAFRDRRPPQFR